MGSPLAVAVSAQDRETIHMVGEAIARHRVLMAWQPVVSSADPAKVAFHEGLIRIMDPKGRVIPATDFIGAVENQELGREIDCLALEMGLAQLARHPDLRLSINMSARSIGYPRWMAVLHRGLSSSPAVGERLILEITESSAMLIPELVASFMADLRGRGIAFALDDFGAGYTAFRYFRDFFFDILKIDAQFIRNVHADPDNQVLVAALLSIARHFDMACVAEAVETPNEALWLGALGVDLLQGYAFGAPTTRPAWAEETRRRA
ncbi:MAG: EAL domain-containing protein [Paracoccaceae bacterium]